MKLLARLRLAATLDNVPRAVECVRESARAVGLDDRLQGQLQLAVDEACANVVDHAYQDLEPGDMEVSCGLTDRAFVVCVRDWGRGFDLDAVSVPDVTAPLQDRALGGLGLYLIRQVMDEVRLTLDPRKGNVLTMIKRLPGRE